MGSRRPRRPLYKADLVTGLVGEFPELQGLIGGHLVRAQGEPAEIADAIRDHYKSLEQAKWRPPKWAVLSVYRAAVQQSVPGTKS